MNNTVDVLIIGGGAAGFFAAIQAKENAPHASVLILEAAGKCLGKVKISGGGRCNVTHACFDISRLVTAYPRGQRELKSVFSRFAPQDTVQWFESRGVKLKTEADGRMFPVTDDSQTIIDCLQLTARSLGVEIYTKASVADLTWNDGMGLFKVLMSDSTGQTWHARRVLLATGSSPRSHAWLTALGHQLISSVPSLFTFHVRDKALTELSGLSFPLVRAKLKVEGYKPLLQEGPLLITHWGLSGPVILRLSAWGARLLAESQYQAQLLVDIAPEHTADEIYAACMARKKEKSAKFIVNDAPISVPKRFWEYFLQRLGLPLEARWLEISDKQCRRLAETCKAFDFQVSGKSVFKEEFVTAGGVPLKEVDLKTMQSRLCSQLYLAGEVLDVDAVTGGFNFQNAWSTGYIAGRAIAESLKLS